MQEPTSRRPQRTRGRVQVNGALLAYERVGSGPPVVFVPPFGTDRRVWCRQVATFSQHHEVVRFDPRGCGRSSRGLGPFRAAADLAALLDALGIQQTAMIASGDGAEVALELMVDRPQLVRALILESPRLGDLETRLGRAYLREGRPLVMHMPRVSSPAERKARHAAERRMLVIRLQNGPRLWPAIWDRARLDSYVSRWSDPPISERLSEVVAPTLILVGGLANSAPLEEAEYVLAGIIGAQMVRVPNVSAYPSVPLEAADQFNRLALDFLAAHYRPEPPTLGTAP